MDVIIVSKTHMTTAACVGAISTSGKYLRLLNDGGYNQPIDTEFEVRQVWDIEFETRQDIRTPHVEDVIITSKELKGTLKDELTMLNIVERFKVPVWRGSPDVLFDGILHWTDSGSGYVSEEGEVPNHSVGFWIPDRNLTKKIFYEKVRYNYPKTNGWRSFPFVGFENVIETIPANTLVRVSLARWWDTKGTTENRCSLQLSGWYDLPRNDVDVEEDDLLF